MMKHVLLFFGALVAGIALGYLIFWFMQGDAETFLPGQNRSSPFGNTLIETQPSEPGKTTFGIQSFKPAGPIVVER